MAREYQHRALESEGAERAAGRIPGDCAHARVAREESVRRGWVRLELVDEEFEVLDVVVAQPGERGPPQAENQCDERGKELTAGAGHDGRKGVATAVDGGSWQVAVAVRET